MSRLVEPRLVVYIDGGCLERVSFEGFERSRPIHILVIDRDTEGADPADTFDLGGERVYVTVTAPEPMEEDEGADIAKAYEAWLAS